MLHDVDYLIKDPVILGVMQQLLTTVPNRFMKTTIMIIDTCINFSWIGMNAFSYHRLIELIWEKTIVRYQLVGQWRLCVNYVCLKEPLDAIHEE